MSSSSPQSPRASGSSAEAATSIPGARPTALHGVGGVGGIRGTTRLIGILGHPLSHSYSPAMHNGGIRGMGLDLAYLPFPVKTAGLATLLAALKSVGFLGVNVTMPHKQAVVPLCDTVSELSRVMGAVNTIVHRDGKLHGTTTDPEGFINAFRDAGHDFEGKSVAVLGNGGSARTIAFALALMTKARRATLVARAPEKSAALIDEVRAAAPGFAIGSLALADYAAARRDFDVVVNTTPVGMHPDVSASPLEAGWLVPGQVVYDILYNPEETALLRAARAAGCEAVGGLGMLVHQGIASFRLWTGLDPDPRFYYEGIRLQQALEHGGRP
jgi:shikimate dehydrogenase